MYKILTKTCKKILHCRNHKCVYLLWSFVLLYVVKEFLCQLYEDGDISNPITGLDRPCGFQ